MTQPTTLDTSITRCCIVGGGPAGMVLGYMLARAGVDTTLLEEHQDFDRDFRGDTIHPSVLQILDELGLAESLLELPHAKVPRLSVRADDQTIAIADFSALPTAFPYIAMIPQAEFLSFMASRAGRFPNFRLIMGAAVRELVHEEGLVRGVRYRDREGWHEVRALLSVAADGRFSRMRKLADVTARETSAPMDVLWFRLPRRPGDPEESQGQLGNGHILVMLNRADHWQLGYVIPKGAYRDLHAAGLDDLRQHVTALAPILADRLQEIREWRQVSLLSVESDLLPRWHKPGLLFIGDAAHTMSPVGGVGINYAIQDAVVTANLLTRPLLAGRMSQRQLARVQRERAWPTRIAQFFQALAQARMLGPVLRSRGPVRIPLLARLLLRIPAIRVIPAYLIGLGISPVHVQEGGSD